MSNRIFVKPATPDLKVRKPVGGHLLAEGEAQNDDSYWRRRELDGDVVITEVAATEPAVAPAIDTGAAGATGASSKKR